MNNFVENENKTLEPEVSRKTSWNSHLATRDHDSLTFPDGVYTGSWNINLEFTGHGNFALDNGTIYNGIWNPINQTGIGTITFPGEIMEMPEDGRRVKLYNGSWNNNFEFIEGKLEIIEGTCTNNIKTYNGVWNPDKSGTGTLTVTSKLSRGVYTGSWDTNLDATGQGTFVLDNGTIYQGEWIPTNLLGIGTITFLDGTTYTGAWNNNFEFIGEGVWSE